MNIAALRISFLAVGAACASVMADASVLQLPQGPLIVDSSSQVVVLEYEAWFGPRAVTFQGTAAKPVLQSPDMQSVGGGYDSADPSVIRQHVAWMETMGIDAAISEVTNNVSCIFNSAWFAARYIPNCTPAFRAYNQTIRDNTGNLYPAWTALGTRLKLIPLLGGIDSNVLYLDLDGKSALQKEIEYFGGLLDRYPERKVIYRGKPLMLIFLGAGQDPSFADDPLWLKIRQFLEAHPAIAARYTFIEMAGYLDSQPQLWLDPGTPAGPVEVSPAYRFWSWVDRLNPTCAASQYCPYFPSYNRAGARVENFTASLATAGQNGWGCPKSDAPPYCPDDALRHGPGGEYDTLASFMVYARELDPIFLILHQFNEYVPPDEGWDANTDDDAEPADLWGYGAVAEIRQQIQIYRER
jgi:hypothetical protein